VAWDALDDGLIELRACRDADELADRACIVAMSCCGADRVALGRIRDGVWSPWRAAAAADDMGPLVPRGPTALEELPTEREVVRTGLTGVRGTADRDRRRTGSPGAEAEVIVAGVRGGGAVVGLVHVATSREAQPAIVEAFADALSSMFALLDVRDRVHTQGRVLGGLVADVEELRQDDAVELVPARRPTSGGAPMVSANAPGGTMRALLTDRQGEVLDLMLAGQSNAEIAERLVLAVSTVKSHVRAVLRAVGAINRADAVARFTRDQADAAADWLTAAPVDGHAKRSRN
jgi:DNA-binding CsgD family transcriptional regulator